MRFETKAIHSGMDVANPSRSIVPPIEPSTVFEIDKEGRREDDLHYTRHSNPNRLQLEHIISDLEGGEAAAAFSSGVAAIAAVLQSLNPGDHILVPDDVYAGTRRLISNIMRRWELKYDFISMSDVDRVFDAVVPSTRLIWIETPSNPMMDITDIKSIAQEARERSILTCVDNTWPTPVNQRPLELGAHLVMHSTTKYFGGHSDILGGAIVTRSQTGIFERIREIQQSAGSVPSPHDCWLMSRSIRTLPYRMRGHNDHAEHLARYLQNHPKVEKVYYPGLATHVGHEIAAKQMEGFGGMISFLVAGSRDEAVKIVGRSQLISRATSLGGVESTWEHRRSSEGEDSATPDNLIRLSVGLEHPDDLMEDLDQALS